MNMKRYKLIFKKIYVDEYEKKRDNYQEKRELVIKK